MKTVRYLGSAFLSAVLLTPVAVNAAQMIGQPSAYRLVNDDPRREAEKRYYDRQAKDYHNWTREEDEAYRHYLEERHEKYREFAKLNRKQQEEYWKWRHEHPQWR